LSKLIF